MYTYNLSVVVLTIHIAIFCKVSRHYRGHSLTVVLFVHDFIIPEFLWISLSKDYISHIERLSIKVVVIFREQLCIV